MLEWFKSNKVIITKAICIAIITQFASVGLASRIDKNYIWYLMGVFSVTSATIILGIITEGNDE